MISMSRFASLATFTALGFQCAPALSFTAEQAAAGRTLYAFTLPAN